jgi:hypothetical protein
MDNLIVLFRAERSGLYKGNVTAVFPTDIDVHGYFTVYAHAGQHGSGSRGWYNKTRAATEADYADLLKELRGIYETGDNPTRLVVRKRWPAK